MGCVFSGSKSVMPTTNKIPKTHFKCRNSTYPRCKDIQRPTIPDNQVLWSSSWAAYSPLNFTSDGVKAKPVWADVDIREDKSTKLQFNQMDDKTDRRSHMGKYEIVEGLPRNPVGRTGLVGRGALGRWGPNHAADPVVTRWKRDNSGNIVKHPETKKNILQVVAIKRSDTGEWALPGGMVDPGEQVSVTLKREFGEEALNSLELTDEQRKSMEAEISQFFAHGKEIYRGYVDDPRNTDNAWMETVAYNFHDDTGEVVGRFKLNAGDDAVGVNWTDISKDLRLYASHEHFVRCATDLHNAHW